MESPFGATQSDEPDGSAAHSKRLRTTFADRGNTPADVQPTVFLKEMGKVIAVGDFAVMISSFP
jgi:hypothetical protein